MNSTHSSTGTNRIFHPRYELVRREGMDLPSGPRSQERNIPYTICESENTADGKEDFAKRPQVVPSDTLCWKLALLSPPPIAQAPPCASTEWGVQGCHTSLSHFAHCILISPGCPRQGEGYLFTANVPHWANFRLGNFSFV